MKTVEIDENQEYIEAKGFREQALNKIKILKQQNIELQGALVQINKIVGRSLTRR